MSCFRERDYLGPVVVGIGDTGALHKALTREILYIVFHPSAVAVVGKLSLVVHAYHPELSDLRQ